MTDSELITLILQGDRDSFRILVERYQQMVFRTCMGFLHNREEAEDLAQDVFIRAYQSLSRFRGESAFSTWLYRIAVNASLNRTRRSSLKITFETLENTVISAPATSEDDPEKILISREQSVWLRRAVNSLPENQRTAIILSKYEDLSQKEIAEIMMTSEGAVESLLFRAKRNLRKRLSSESKKIEKRHRKK
ncbi:MAG TPA: sigma-70 family RNA polymerase sigma factor [Bacteroidales bacterium]|jgi:RNA polymerase sigma-70 factor (ECF subfamily)|nr:sigma-70 family RNA polymerase sigma factor [Bacteroidales bacterium]HOS71894.1 sigma-70 family RNA polymerase sigma factor [Bacteroidales bacterium]HQH23216.1 sigma-70 family RNA polymerase sigma factor [Bacteroidales bacterium]HQJ80926.1 sigma-70 family RNA polymerase sigma factor [Bacteroidales bacterium]